MEEDLLKWEAVVLGGIQWDEIISGFLEFWISRLLDSCISILQCFHEKWRRIFSNGRLLSWLVYNRMKSFLDSWSSGFLDSWVPGFLSAREFMRNGGVSSQIGGYCPVLYIH